MTSQEEKTEDQPENYLQTTWKKVEIDGETICEARTEIRNLKLGWEAEPRIELRNKNK